MVSRHLFSYNFQTFRCCYNYIVSLYEPEGKATQENRQRWHKRTDKDGDRRFGKEHVQWTLLAYVGLYRLINLSVPSFIHVGCLGISNKYRRMLRMQSLKNVKTNQTSHPPTNSISPVLTRGWIWHAPGMANNNIWQRHIILGTRQSSYKLCNYFKIFQQATSCIAPFINVTYADTDAPKHRCITCL